MGSQSVLLRDITARDGIQNEQPISIEARVRLVNSLVDAGIRSLEVGSFVRSDIIPAMANTADVFAKIDRNPDTTYWALVPNEKGALLALEANADALTITASASEIYAQKNVGKTVAESIAECSRIASVADGKPIDAVISCSFGSPWEGDFDAKDVATVANRLLDAGATHVTLADTTGMGTPRLVMALVHELGNEIGFHFHDTRGTALVNAVAAMSAGARQFDTAVGSIGGSPFAVDAGGNLGTEDLLHLLEDFGVSTGINFESILEIAGFLKEQLGHELNSKVSLRGPRWKKL
jgi:hydroxymethylglutaryl-CoA lyase